MDGLVFEISCILLHCFLNRNKMNRFPVFSVCQCNQVEWSWRWPGQLYSVDSVQFFERVCGQLGCVLSSPHIHIHKYIYIYIYIYLHVYIYIYICVYIHQLKSKGVVTRSNKPRLVGRLQHHRWGIQVHRVDGWFIPCFKLLHRFFGSSDRGPFSLIIVDSHWFTHQQVWNLQLRWPRLERNYEQDM